MKIKLLLLSIVSVLLCSCAATTSKNDYENFKGSSSVEMILPDSFERKLVTLSTTKGFIKGSSKGVVTGVLGGAASGFFSGALNGALTLNPANIVTGAISGATTGAASGGAQGVTLGGVAGSIDGFYDGQTQLEDVQGKLVETNRLKRLKEAAIVYNDRLEAYTTALKYDVAQLIKTQNEERIVLSGLKKEAQKKRLAEISRRAGLRKLEIQRNLAVTRQTIHDRKKIIKAADKKSSQKNIINQIKIQTNITSEFEEDLELQMKLLRRTFS